MGPFDPKWDRPALWLVITCVVIVIGSIALHIITKL